MIPGTRVRVLTADGRIRSALVTGEADTFYTVPARVTVRGRTVTGHVYRTAPHLYVYPWSDVPEYEFSPDAWRKNAAMLPAWPDMPLRGMGDAS